MNAIDITPIAQALVALAAAVVSAVVVPWIRSKLGAEEMTEFLRWVELGVAAAEQLFSSADGLKKKTYVVNYLKEKGYTVDVEDIDNAIEAAVLKLHDELYGQAFLYDDSDLILPRPGEVSTVRLKAGGDTVGKQS